MKKQCLRKHLAIHESDGKCRLCAKEFTSLFILIEHMNLSHNSGRLRGFWCCNKLFASSVLFSRHISTIHPEPKPPKEEFDEVEFRLVCNICRSGFLYRTNLYLHLHKFHELDIKNVFKVVAGLGMLHYKLVWICRKCPKVSETQGKHLRYSCNRHRQNYGMYSLACRQCNRWAGQGIKQTMLIEMPHMFPLEHETYFDEAPRVNMDRYLDRVSDSKTIVCTFSGEKTSEVLLDLECPKCKQPFSQIGPLTKHYISTHDRSRRLTEIRIETK